MTQAEGRAMGQFRQALAGLYLLKYGLAAAAAWAFVYGSVVLALRGAVGLSRLDLAWGLLSLPVALVPAVVLAWRRLPAEAAVRALLDRHSRAGGLLMTGAEQDLGDWQGRLPELRAPALRWRGGKAWALLAGGLAFVAAGFLLPQGFADMGGRRLDVDKEVDQLQKQVGVLEQEKALKQTEAEALTEKLSQLRRGASARDPVKALESLDYVQDRTSRAAQDAAESATRKAEALGRAEALAEALQKLQGKVDREALTDAMSKLAALARQGGSQGERAQAALDEALDALKKGKLSAAQLKKLAEALKDAKGKQAEMVERLVQAKLLDADALEKCEQAGQCDMAGLAAFLKENGGDPSLADMLAQIDEPGNGGTDRGPGPAKLRFGDQSLEEGIKFKEEELPPASLRALKETSPSGLSGGAPPPDKGKGGPASAGALAGTRAGGGSASTQTLLPRHRGTVQRYFDRPAKAPK